MKLLSPNIIQVADPKRFLSAKDAKDAKKSEGMSEFPAPWKAHAAWDALAFFASFASFASFADKKNGPGVRDSSMRE